MLLVKRKIILDTETVLGAVVPFAEFIIRARRDIIADGRFIPQKDIPVKTDANGHVEKELYTLVNSFVPYRIKCVSADNDVDYKFDLAPGGDILFADLLNLELLSQDKSATIAAASLLDSIITAHEAKADPHNQYLTNTRGDVRYYTKSQSDANNNTARDAVITMLRAGVNVAGDNLSKIHIRLLAQEALVGGTTPDGDDVVNRVQELYTIFQDFSETTNLIAQLTQLQNQLDNLSVDIETTVRLNVDQIPLTARQLIRTDGDGRAIDSSISDGENEITFSDKAITRFSPKVEVRSAQDFITDNDGHALYIISQNDNGKLLQFVNAPTYFLMPQTYFTNENGEVDISQNVSASFACSFYLVEPITPYFKMNDPSYLKSKNGDNAIDGEHAVVTLTRLPDGNNYLLTGQTTLVNL